MLKLTRTLALVVLTGVFAAGAVDASVIRDDARMFSPAGVERATQALAKIERERHLPVTIETIESLKGETISDAAETRAKARGRKGMTGLYILMSKRDHKIEVLSDPKLTRVFPIGDSIAVRESFVPLFKQGKFDEGLMKGIQTIDEVSGSLDLPAAGHGRAGAHVGGERARGLPPAAGAKQGGGSIFGPMFMILALILGVTFLIRIFSGLSRARQGYGGAPGPMGGQMAGGPMGGGPMAGGGYGGYPQRGGGGFWSSILGGMGGAMAGNWIYDQMSGRRHSSWGGQEGYDASQTGGADGNDAAGDAGGDWGSTGGADWGGGDAGGDWGGGGGDMGGGDWGGGGGDGGSW